MQYNTTRFRLWHRPAMLLPTGSRYATRRTYLIPTPRPLPTRAVARQRSLPLRLPNDSPCSCSSVRMNTARRKKSSWDRPTKATDEEAFKAETTLWSNRPDVEMVKAKLASKLGLEPVYTSTRSDATLCIVATLIGQRDRSIWPSYMLSRRSASKVQTGP